MSTAGCDAASKYCGFVYTFLCSLDYSHGWYGGDKESRIPVLRNTFLSICLYTSWKIQCLYPPFLVQSVFRGVQLMQRFRTQYSSIALCRCHMPFKFINFALAHYCALCTFYSFLLQNRQIIQKIWQTFFLNSGYMYFCFHEICCVTFSLEIFAFISQRASFITHDTPCTPLLSNWHLSTNEHE